MTQLIGRIDLDSDGGPFPVEEVARQVVLFAVSALRVATLENLIFGKPEFPAETSGVMVLEAGSAVEMCGLVSDKIGLCNSNPASKITIEAVFQHGEPVDGTTTIQAKFVARRKDQASVAATPQEDRA